MENTKGTEDVKKTKPKNSKPHRTVDTYAAQCESCKKWRVIPTVEEYEEIRNGLPDKPFLCKHRGDASCDYPPDIEYGASNTWVMDKPGIPKTPGGFKRTLVMRRDFSKMDAYYLTPTGKKLRSVNEIATFINQDPSFKDINVSEFNFTSPRVMEDTIPEGALLKSPSSSNKKAQPKKV